MELEREFNELLKEKGFRCFKESHIDDEKIVIDTYGIGESELSDDEIRQNGWIFTFDKIYSNNARYKKMIYNISDTMPDTFPIFKY